MQNKVNKNRIQMVKLWVNSKVQSKMFHPKQNKKMINRRYPQRNKNLVEEIIH